MVCVKQQVVSIKQQVISVKVYHVIKSSHNAFLRDVCNMCRRSRASMECNHVTTDEDYHRRFVLSEYHSLVGEYHLVSIKMHFVTDIIVNLGGGGVFPPESPPKSRTDET